MWQCSSLPRRISFAVMTLTDTVYLTATRYHGFYICTCSRLLRRARHFISGSACSSRTRAGTGLVGCARVPGEERSEGDADRVARASIAPQHTCSVAMLLDPCTYTRDPSLLTSPLEVTDFDQESRHGLASTSLALAAACRRRGSHTLAAARYLHRSTWPLSRRASGPPRPHSPAHMVSSSSSNTS